MDKTTTRLTTFLKERTPHKKETYFSNSLRIHQVKTKKIITVKEVWILWILTILLLHLLFYFLLYFILYFFDREDISNTPDIVLSAPQTVRISQNYFAARRVYNSLLGVWLSWWNTVCRVWYILCSMNTPGQSQVKATVKATHPVKQ